MYESSQATVLRKEPFFPAAWPNLVSTVGLKRASVCVFVILKKPGNVLLTIFHATYMSKFLYEHAF